jgi:hypothetical protein
MYDVCFCSVTGSERKLMMSGSVAPTGNFSLRYSTAKTMWLRISAPALLLMLTGAAGAAVAFVESRGRLLLGCGVEVRAGTGPVGREDEALREADSDISDLNFAMLAARDMMAVFVWGVGVCGRMGIRVQRVQQRVLDSR